MASCSLLFFLWCSYFGFDLWLHRLNYGTFNGVVRSEASIPLNFYQSDGTTVQIQSLQHDYTILNFWSTICGSSVRELPAVEELMGIYKNNPAIGVYGVHGWVEQLGENYATGQQILSDEQYSFPTFSINYKDPVLRELGVTGYPTVVILDKQGKIAFRGTIENAKRFMRNILLLEI